MLGHNKNYSLCWVLSIIERQVIINLAELIKLKFSSHQISTAGWHVKNDNENLILVYPCQELCTVRDDKQSFLGIWGHFLLRLQPGNSVNLEGPKIRRIRMDSVAKSSTISHSLFCSIKSLSSEESLGFMSSAQTPFDKSK